MHSQEFFEYLMAFITGLIFGSFLNVCIYRTPLGLAPLGRSFCPRCKKPIPLLRNFPVLSYLLQKGKSACCQKAISKVYPAIEIATGVLSVLTLLYTARTYTVYGGPAHLHHLVFYYIWFLTFVCPLIVLTVIDIQHMILPDVITLPFMLIGVVVQLIMTWPDYLGALKTSGLGILIGGGSLLLIGEIISRLKKKDAMGGGDIKLAALFGAFLGWKSLIFIFFAASVLGLLYVVAVSVAKRNLEQAKQQFFFGPFLCAAALLYLYYGRAITDWYFHRLGQINPFFP